MRKFDQRINNMVKKMATCENCMGGLECKEHVLEHKAPEPVERDAYRVKELISTSTHDKLKDHILQKMKKIMAQNLKSEFEQQFSSATGNQVLVAPVKLGPLKGVKGLKPVRTMKTSPRAGPVTLRRVRYDSQKNRSVGKSFDQAIPGIEFNSTAGSPRAPTKLPALGPFKSKLQPVRGSNS